MRRQRLFWQIFPACLALIGFCTLGACLLGAHGTKSILFGAAAVVVAAALSALASRRIARPIAEMKRGVERLAAGELGHRLSVPQADELGQLAAVINDMAGRMDARMRLLTTQRGEQEAVFSSMVEGVLAVDARQRVLRMNPAAGRLFGVSPAEAERKNILEVVRNVSLQEFIARTLESAVPTEGEIWLHGAEERWLQAHGAILHDPSGARMGAVVVLNDITRIRRLEAFRRDFVANVSHELRTPITSIKGFVETLLNGAMREPESAEKFLVIIARQAERLNAIITDLLLLSTLEQHGERGRIPDQEAAIRDVLDAAVESCAARAGEKRTAIQVDCANDLRARVNVALLEQAVINLLDNAIKYSEPGKPVAIEAVRSSDSLIIRVRDEGCGIEPEHLARVFERFYRVDKGRSREAGGTGLGLAIVKHITQAHGGAVTVESAPGKGSIFTMTIPAAPAQA